MRLHFGLAAVCLLVSAGAAQAQAAGGASTEARTEVKVRMARCDALGEDRAWLACLEAATQPMRAQLAMPPAPPAPAPQPPRQPEAARPAAQNPSITERFGLHLPKAAPEPQAQIVSPVTAYRFDRFGMFTVTLSNGQTWRQIPADTNVAHWIKPASSYVARIRRGALGGYNLSLDRENGSFKVLRVE